MRIEGAYRGDADGLHLPPPQGAPGSTAQQGPPPTGLDAPPDARGAPGPGPGFASHPMKVLSRIRILNLLRRHCSVTERGLDVVVFRLRAALKVSPSGRQYIKTLRGEGYVFSPDESLARPGMPEHRDGAFARSEGMRMSGIAANVLPEESVHFEDLSRRMQQRAY